MTDDPNKLHELYGELARDIARTSLEELAGTMLRIAADLHELEQEAGDQLRNAPSAEEGFTAAIEQAYMRGAQHVAKMIGESLQVAIDGAGEQQ